MKRFTILVAGYCAIGAVVAPALVRPAPRLVWNASASVPIGLYAARSPAGVRRGDLVAVHAPAAVARLMAERGYLPPGVPMLKHVAATAGQTVCRFGARVSIDGTPVAEARSHDRNGRPLPVWSGCWTLQDGEVLLLNPASASSFDGRYFGPVAARSITAILTPLWLPGTAGEGPEAARISGQPAPNPETKGPSR
ncbi:S26 family signal peptidase [Sphingomonas sp.]|uniref:S26 family signal peptidase n=1 Tax=Sphingomonas sp. TaxID=28214 RepID=UPI002ED93AEC